MARATASLPSPRGTNNMRNKFIRTPSFWERNSGKILYLFLVAVAASLIGIMFFGNLWMK
jgi:hypothetical protein